jgi:hypothetical protein
MSSSLRQALTVSIIAMAGCGGLELDGERDTFTHPAACTAAASRLKTCFGYPFLERCDEEQASQLASLSCNELTQLLLSGEADDLGVSSSLQDQLREAFRRAVSQAISAALQPALGLLSSALDRPLYLSLARASTEDEALSKAQQLAPYLAGHAGMEPTVMALPSGYAVVHSRCALDLAQSFGDVVAALIVAQPELIRLLGGSFEAAPTDEGVRIHLDLPLSLLAVADSVPAQLGCEQ